MKGNLHSIAVTCTVCALLTCSLDVVAQSEGEFDSSIIMPDVHDNAGIASNRTLIADTPNEVIDPFSGALTLSSTDLVWPGDGGFDLRINRVYSSKVFESKVAGSYTGPEASSFLAPSTTGLGWSLHFGRVEKSIVFDWDGTTPLEELTEPVSFSVCDFDDDGDTSNGQLGADIHNNALLVTPDGETSPLYVHVTNEASYLPLNERMDFITAGLWTANCLNGGEGLEVHSPAGWKYTMNQKLIDVRLIDQNRGLWEAAWHTSKIEDPNGNSMDITYSGSYRLEALIDEINTSDGRQVFFNYTTEAGSDIPLLTSISTPFFSATAGIPEVAEQVWSYGYELLDNNFNNYFQLKTVTRPDGLVWTFDHYPGTGFPIATANDYGLQQVTFPYGATTTYEYNFVHFYNSVTVPERQQSIVISRKTTGGREIEPGVWTYQYAPGLPDGTLMPPEIVVSGTALYPGINLTTVETPSSREEYSFYGSYTANTEISVFSPLVGKLVKKEIFEPSGSVPVRSETYEWDNVRILSSEDNFNPVLVDPRHFKSTPPGEDPFDNGLLDTKETDVALMQQSEVAITVDGTTYTTTIPNAYFWYGQPNSVTELGQDTRSVLYNYFPISRNLNINKTTLEAVNYEPGGDGRYDVTRVFDGSGNLTNVWQHNVYEEYVVDTVGNRVEVNNGLSLDGVDLKSEFLDYKLGIPQSEVHPEGITASRVVGPLGNIIRETNGRGYSTTYQYDGLNRVTRITPPGGGSATLVNYTNTGWTEFRFPLNREITVDGYGRPVCVLTDNIYTRRDYDSSGRVDFVSLPSYSECNLISQGVTFAYDALDRLLSTENADQTTRTSQYLTGNRVRMTDENAHQTTYVFRSYGNPDAKDLIRIESPENIDTIFVKDVLGNTTSITQEERGGGGESFTRSYIRDHRNFVVQEIHPETGATTLTHTPLGHLKTKQVGNSPVTTIVYDGLFRREGIIYPDTSDVLFVYDENSNLTNINNGSAYVTYEYNQRDVLDNEQYTVRIGSPDRTYVFDYALDSSDRLLSMTYPSGDSVTFNPDPLGRPTTALPYVTSVTRHANGTAHVVTLGNGLTTTMGQNDRQWPNSILTSGGIQDLTYEYQGNGNIDSITDSVSPDESKVLIYDDVDRLTGITSNLVSGGFEYSPTGNIESKHITGSYLSYAYENNKLASVTELGPDLQARQGRVVFGYDDYGNASSRVSDPVLGNPPGSTEFRLDDYDWEYSYNDAMQLDQVLRDGAAFREYFYDGRGLRVVSRKETDVQSDHHFVYGANEKLIGEFNRFGLPRKEYIYLDKRLIAINEHNLEGGLNISIGSDREEYVPGDTVLFTITVTNAGEVDAESVSFSDLMPDNIQVTSSNAESGSYDAGTDTWIINSLLRESGTVLEVTGEVLP